MSKPLTHSATDSDHTPLIYCIDGDKVGKAEREGGSGFGVRQSDTQYCLTAKDVHGVAYAIGSYDSNSWKSSNPNSGVNKVEISKSLDASSCGNPTCNQGGMAVVEPIVSTSGDFMTVTENGIVPTLMARDYKDPMFLTIDADGYAV